MVLLPPVEVLLMAALSLSELKALAADHEGGHVSIYLPVEPAGPETRQNTIRLKNLIRDAEEKLQEWGLRSTEALELLRPIWELETDTDFWQEREEGLALLLKPGELRTVWLPFRPPELSLVSDHFYL